MRCNGVDWGKMGFLILYIHVVMFWILMHFTYFLVFI